ncbi:MAG: hypothetical protein OSA38_05935 [Candidatus Poseidoniaceae archaeon]|nr:hypothetical protein [Candidatus Poseidoniaceae archaeon]
MTHVPDEVLQALARLSGYDRMLETDKISAQYGVTSEWIEQQLGPSTPVSGADPATFAPSSKEMPGLPTVPNPAEKRSFRFAYDPSSQAAERRKSVEQAILCPSCGVTLGIPSIRPIKVTCPQCLQESTFQA